MSGNKPQRERQFGLADLFGYVSVLAVLLGLVRIGVAYDEKGLIAAGSFLFGAFVGGAAGFLAYGHNGVGLGVVLGLLFAMVLCWPLLALAF